MLRTGSPCPAWAAVLLWSWTPLQCRTRLRLAKDQPARGPLLLLPDPLTWLWVFNVAEISVANELSPVAGAEREVVLRICFLWYKLGNNTFSSGAVPVKGSDIWGPPGTRTTQVFYDTSLPRIFLGFFIRCIFGRCTECVSFWGDCVDPRADDFARSFLVWPRCPISDSEVFIKPTCGVLVIVFTLRPSFFFPGLALTAKGNPWGWSQQKTWGWS